MTDKRYRKLVRILSVFAGIGILTSIPAGIIEDDILIVISILVSSIAFIALFSVISTRTELTSKLEKRIWFSLPVLLALVIPGGIFYIIPLIVVSSILTLLALGILVFFSPKRSKRRILFLLSFMVVGFFMKRQHWPGATVLITLTLGTLAFGSLVYGVHILLKHKDNLYFRIIGSFCFLLITLQSLAITFKFNHWPGGGLLVYMAGVPTLVTTLLVLITLPGSGFINWKKEQQRILTRKILIPWIFLLLFMAVKTLLPGPVQQRIFEADVTVKIPFDMTPYEVEMKDGMEEGE